MAQNKINEGFQVWLFGSKSDKAVSEDIVNHITAAAQKHCHNIAGETSLEDAIDLMSLASAVVTNDSGLMHVAAALKRPLVVLYGSSSDDFTPPLTDLRKILHTDIECRPCFQRSCPLQHMKCLNDLDPARVVTALRDII